MAITLQYYLPKESASIFEDWHKTVNNDTNTLTRIMLNRMIQIVRALRAGKMLRHSSQMLNSSDVLQDIRPAEISDEPKLNAEYSSGALDALKVLEYLEIKEWLSTHSILDDNDVMHNIITTLKRLQSIPGPKRVIFVDAEEKESTLRLF